jgi:hypothetical protein
MADHQRVIEFLRDVRQGPLQAVTDEITQLAADYAGLCVQANERLRQCSTFLQQGLRSEAIHLAEAAPNLLDLVAALDLPDQAAWVEFCQNNGLAVPPPLQLDRAAQLNEAYAQDQPLEHLLARHRLLALSRAPVRDRLDVMRKIAQLDAANGNWEKDIRLFERARLQELPAAFYSAVKNKDDRGITGLMEELSQQAWYEAVPADLTAAVGDAYGRVQRAAVEVELKKLVDPLRDAYAARSLPECQALVQRWKNTMAAGGVTVVSPELLDEIRPVVALVTEEARKEEVGRRFREACKGFTALLDQDAADAQLEAGYARLKEFNEPIPEDLTRRYMAKRSGRRRAAERSHKVRLVAIGSVAAGLIVVGVVTALLVTRSATSRKWADRIEQQLRQHSKAGLDAAQGYVADLQRTNPGLLKDSQVAAAVTDLQTQQAAFTRDQGAVQALLRRAEEARRLTLPVVTNAAAPIAEVGAAGDQLQGVVNDAAAAEKELAWVDPENKLGAARAGLQTNLAALRERILAAARTELDAVGTKLDAVPTSFTTPEAATEARAEIAALSDRVGALRGLPLLDDETQAAISALGQKVVARRQGADASRTAAEELQAVRRAETAADLRAALDGFIRRYPDDPRAADFGQASQRTGLAAGLDAWLQLAGTFGGRLPAGNLPATQKRLDAVAAYLAAHPDSPLAGPVQAYADYLKHAADALQDKGAWQAGLADLVSTPLMTDLGVMSVSDGRQYYVLGDIKRVERKINNRVSVTFLALDLKDLTKRVSISVDPPQTVSDAPAAAPHTKVVGDLVEELKLINEGNWDTFGIGWAERLRRDDKIDSVVKGMLLLQILKTQEAVAGWGLEDVYGKTIAELSRQNLPEQPWLDPAKVTEGTRKAIKQTVEAMPSEAAVKQKLGMAKAGMFKAVTLDVVGTGVLMKDDAGQWTVYSKNVPPGGSLLWTAVPGAGPAAAAGGDGAATAPAAGPGSLLLLGTVAGNRIVLDDTAVRMMPQGSLVYVTRP